VTCRGAHTFLVNSFLPMSLMNWCWRAVTSYSIWYPPTQHRNRMRKKTICIRWNAVHACCTRIPATSYEKLQSIRDGLPYRHAVLETLGPGGVKSESRWRQISQGASERASRRRTFTVFVQSMCGKMAAKTPCGDAPKHIRATPRCLRITKAF
jgi:hypothetical protein